MYGIDLGITVSSVTLVAGNNKVLDTVILFGDRKQKNEWKRITNMAEAIADAINSISLNQSGRIVESLVSIEEPVYPYKTRNPRSYFVLSCLYALVRNKLGKRSFETWSINPISVKTTAKTLAFKDKKLSEKYAVKGRLTKKGMIRAFKKLNKCLPNYHTQVGQETLADSYFIARTGMDRRKLGLK